MGFDLLNTGYTVSHLVTLCVIFKYCFDEWIHCWHRYFQMFLCALSLNGEQTAFGEQWALRCRQVQVQPNACVSGVMHQGAYHDAKPASPHWVMERLAIPPHRALQHTISPQTLTGYLKQIIITQPAGVPIWAGHCLWERNKWEHFVHSEMMSVLFTWSQSQQADMLFQVTKAKREETASLYCIYLYVILYGSNLMNITINVSGWKSPSYLVLV